MGGGDDAFDFHIEELEELALDETTTTNIDRHSAFEEPTEQLDLSAAEIVRQELARKLAADKAKAAEKKGRLASRAPQPMSAKDVLLHALQQERDAKVREEEEAQRALEEKRRVAAQVAAQARAQAQERAEAARRKAEEEAREEAEARALAEADRAAFAGLASGKAPPPMPRRNAPRPPTRATQRGPMPSQSATDPMALMLAEGRVEKLLERLGEGYQVGDVFVDINVAVVGPLWEAHVVRAVHDGDLTLATAADHIRVVIQSRPTDLVAARVSRGDAEWAVWVDLDDDKILAALKPAAVYLVGL